jgi:hypothetical protein
VSRETRSDHFRFSSAFIKKKVTKTGFFEKKLKPVQIDQLDFFQFGSVFSGLA